MKKIQPAPFYPEKLCRDRLSLEFAKLLPEKLPELPEDAPRCLFHVPRGMYYDLIPMGVLALRIRMQGILPIFVLCDNLPMCSLRVENQPPRRHLCDQCLRTNTDFLSFNGFSYASIWEYLEAEDVAEAKRISSAMTLSSWISLVM